CCAQFSANRLNFQHRRQRSALKNRSLRGSNPQFVRPNFETKLASGLQVFRGLQAFRGKNKLSRILLTVAHSRALMCSMVVSNCLELRKHAKKRERWPVLVQAGNVRVPIYRDRYSKAGRLYDRYTVVHYETDGTTRTRKREYFTSLDDARFEAQ